MVDETALLRQMEEKYRNIYENAMEGIFQVSPEGRFISANPSLATIHGYDSREDLIQSVDSISSMYVNPEDHGRLMRLLFEKGFAQRFECKMYRKDGMLHWISVNVRTVKNDQGKILCYEGTMQDITQQKLAEEALSESEERYRAAIEHSNDAVCIIQGDRIEFVNRKFVEMFGYDQREEIIGKRIFLIVHPEDRPLVRAVNQRRTRGEPVPARYEFKGIKKNGELVYIEVSAASIAYRGARVYLVYLRDITERKVAEEALRNERNRFRTLSESAPFGIVMIHEKGDFEYINPKFRELFGYDLSDVPNGREWFHKAYPNPKLRREAISAWVTDLRSTALGEKMPKTFPVMCKDGKEKIIHFIPVRLATGEYIVTLEDITERNQAHEALMRSHQELERLNRAKTKAVHHISHELKTPLSVVQGIVRLLKGRLNKAPFDPKLEPVIEALERNLARLLDISSETDDIFRVSQELEAAVVLGDLEGLWQRLENLPDLPQTVRSHLEVVKTWLSQHLSADTASFQSIDLLPFLLQVLERVKDLSKHRNVRFQVEGENNLFLLMDPLILQNVVEGLLRNAVENTPDGGTIRLTLEQAPGKIMLHINDSGVGITEENQSYIFDGLFHTKETLRYASKKPYDFGAGGKGLGLLRTRVYGKRFGFELSMTSKRCVFIPTDQDECPGDISRCPHVQDAEQCAASGGTTFTLSFPAQRAADRDESGVR